MDAPEMPAPDRVPAEGLKHIAAYVDRLFASSKTAVLMLSTRDGISALTVLRMRGMTLFNLIASWEAASPQETAARHYFARLQLAVTEKEQNGQRILGFPVAGDASAVAEAAASVMTVLYGVQPEDGLNFRFDEWAM